MSNQYAERDIMALDEQGGHYWRHVNAMTAEGLHSKSDIAAELAWRDTRIAELERIAAQFKAAALKASTNGYGQDEVHHDDSWIDELDEALRKIQIYDAKRAKVA